MTDVWDMPEGERIIVLVNEFHQPLRHEGCKLTQFLGDLARNPNFAPINFNSWKKVPQNYRNKLWDIVEVKIYNFLFLIYS